TAIYNTIVARNGWDGVHRSQFRADSNPYMGGVISSDNTRFNFVMYQAGVNNTKWNLLTEPLYDTGADLGDDWIPQEASLALGAACEVPAFVAVPAFDVAGNPRPSTGADIGCFQAVGFGVIPNPATLYHQTYVDPVNGNDTWEGTSQARAKKSLNEAIAITEEGGICTLLEGTYTQTSVMVPRTMTIEGAGSDEAIINGASFGTIGIQVLPWATNCVIRGIGFEQSAIGILAGGEGITLRDIRADGMGFAGIWSYGAITVDAERLRIANSGTGASGGVYVLGLVHDTVRIAQCLFSNNTHGVWIQQNCEAMDVENCLFIDNNNGFWLHYVWLYDARIRHCTFIGNRNRSIYLNGIGRSFTLNNSIFAGNNIAADLSGMAPSLCYAARNLFYDNAVDTTDAATLRYNPDPVWTDITDKDLLALRADFGPDPKSPAYNAAYPSDVTVDYWGNPRPFGRTPDIGAVECQMSAGTVIIIR
ncbi:MAG: right-handed parallel beta-helix repeat-containing protein, partial [Kiritimatiellaeota bacterium]|nr:right-handed parallel beta-helix repeat-containing protein [Kiritimatiellota bacterium]